MSTDMPVPLRCDTPAAVPGVRKSGYISELDAGTADLPGVDNAILDPRNSYAEQSQWTEKATRLAGLFVDNFVQYTDTESGENLVAAGPAL